MANSQRVVVDNNVLISRLLLPDSVPSQAVRKVVNCGQLLVSEATLDELAAVLSRSKFDPYVTIPDRQEFLRLLGRIAVCIPIIHTVRVCRDPKDNMILELAVNGRADVIVSGDRDLLALRAFQEIPILTPGRFLELP